MIVKRRPLQILLFRLLRLTREGMKNFESVQNYSDQKWIYECVLCRSRFLRQLATLLWHANAENFTASFSKFYFFIQKIQLMEL